MIANLVIAQMIFLEGEDPDRDINLYIHSPGGMVTAGPRHLRHDAVREAPGVDPVHGPGRRAWARCCSRREPRASATALPNSRIMIHQPLGGTQGQATDIEIYTREMIKMKDQLNGILAKHTGKPSIRSRSDTDRNYFMSAQESKAYGLVDEIMEKRR